MNSTLSNTATINQTQRGRSMIEMLGVLAIIGVLSVGGIAGYSKALQTHKTNNCIEQISTIIANVKNLGLRQHGSYKGLTTKVAQKMKLIPEEMISTSGSSINLTSPFGGEVKVITGKTANSTKQTDEKDFIVAYYSLPKDACLQIMAKNWGEKKIGVLAGADATKLDNAIKDFAHTTTPTCTTKNSSSACSDKQMPLADATTACACGKNSTCAVAIWSF